MRSWLSRLSILLIMLALGCQRNEGSTTLTIGVEPMGGGDKMTVNDAIANWTAGDEVWVNGTPYPVSTAGGTHVTVETSNNGYSAIFPASIVSSDGSTITLPDEYQYRTDSYGNQILDLPLATTSENTTLLFSHLTGALVVKLRNDTTIALTVDTVTVSSNGYAISGSRPMNFGNLATTMAARSGSGSDRKVSLLFDEQEVSLAAGQSCYVMIPVAAVGDTNKFTIEVSTHYQGTRLDSRRTQSNPSAMNCSILAYATMSLHNFLPPIAIFDPSGGYNTYNISSAKDFKNLVTAINQGWTFGGYPYSSFSYQITNNIDMAGDTIEPITGFTGASFDGGNDTISNLTISSSTGYCALFDIISSSYSTTVANVKLQGLKLISNGNPATLKISPFIGHVSGANTFNNCNATVSSVIINGNPSGDIYFGGIAATASANTSFYNCSFHGNINISSHWNLYYGGILGATTSTSSPKIKIESCSDIDTNNIQLTATSIIYAGGVIGEAKKATDSIINQKCLIKIFVNSSNRFNVGGMIGNLTFSGSGMTLRNGTVAGKMVYTDTPYTSYLGTIYGNGNLKGRYNFNSSHYNIIELDYPLSSGNVSVGDPTGRLQL